MNQGEGRKKMDETSRFVATYLINALWEIPVIFGIVILCSRLIHRTPWAHRHTLWVSALILSATVPLVAPRTLVVIRVASATETQVIAERRAESAASAPGGWIHSQYSKRPIVFNTSLIWILVSCYSVFILCRVTILFRAWRSAKRLRLSAFLPSMPATLARVAKLSTHGDTTRNVLILSSPEAVS